MPLPVYVGMRNWDPYLRDTLSLMSRDGVRRAVGVIAAAHRSYSSCAQYRENVVDARRTLGDRRLPDVSVTYVSDWHVSPGFVEANVEHIIDALNRIPEPLRRTNEETTDDAQPVPS